MTWEEHQSQPRLDYEAIETDIDCPHCGKKLYKRIDIVLTTYPPQYRYECKFCHWSDIGF